MLLGKQAGIHPVQPPVFDVEDWRRFGRAEFDFCRVLQSNWIAAADLSFEGNPEGKAEGPALIGCFGSLLEGLTTSMRKIAVATGNFSVSRSILSCRRRWKSERSRPTSASIRVTVTGELRPRSPLAATTVGFWDELHWEIEARNRIVHFRWPADLTVTDEKVRRVAEMADESSMHVNKFARWLSRKEEKLLWAHLAERRHIYPKIGRNGPCPCKSGGSTKIVA